MASFDPETPNQSTGKLCGEWDIAESPEGGPGEYDSLLIYTQGIEARPPRRVEVPPPPRPVAPSPRDRETEIFHAFALESKTASSTTDEDLLGPAPAPAPVPARPAPGSIDGERDHALATLLPRTGETLGGFLIVGELGRGAFARVYLAKEENLGHRLVALKVSRAEGDEPQILARLQHSYIVPIHSVHDDPRTGLRLMCMPYLGGANLAQVLEAAGAKPQDRASGGSLVEALDVVSNRLQSASGLDESVVSFGRGGATPRSLGLSTRGNGLASIRSIPSLWTRISGRGRARAEIVAAPRLIEEDADQPARQFLRQANAIRAAVWIVARLAEGLDHAHSRGLLHRDLKPSNILIAADGTPMLLDFNLSTPARLEEADEGTSVMLGGTLPYMAPEHLDAFHPRGATPPESVDERADLYALGLILYEMIAGEHPFTEPPPGTPALKTIEAMIAQRKRVPSLRKAVSEVPPSLDALVAKCLNPDPSRRHARARDLAEDLRRFLDDLPMKYAPEPSLRERAAKWLRRNPRLRSTSTIAMLSVVLILCTGGIIGLLANSLQGVSARLKYRTFQSAFNECQLLLNTTSGPVEHLGRGIELAQRTLDRQQVSRGDALGEVGWTRWLTPREQTLVREQTAELILLEARAKTFLAGKYGSEANQRQALEWSVRWLGIAEAVDPRPTATLYGDRARYHAALGQAEEAAFDRRREQEVRAKRVDSREYALMGTALLVRHDWARAEAALLRAVTLDSQRFWAWFALGQCRFEQGRFLEAAGSFATCTAIQPRFAWPYLNQGLALACAGRLGDARLAFDQALKENPSFAEALVNRALTRLELNDLPGAQDDLNRAIRLGRSDPGVMAALCEVLTRLGRRDEAETLCDAQLKAHPYDESLRIARAVLRMKSDPVGARADLDRVLERNPRNARAHYLMARMVEREDRRAGLAHVERALEADPSLVDALQLRALLRARLGNLAAIDDVERLVKMPTTHRLYNGACALAVLAETARDRRLNARALELLGRSLDAGFPASEAVADPDWKALRDSPEFRETLRKAQARAEGVRKG